MSARGIQRTFIVTEQMQAHLLKLHLHYIYVGIQSQSVVIYQTLHRPGTCVGVVGFWNRVRSSYSHAVDRPGQGLNPGFKFDFDLKTSFNTDLT